MLAVVIAQNSQRVPDEGTGIGLILLGVAIALAVAFTIFTIFRRASKNATTGAPGDTPPQVRPRRHQRPPGRPHR